MNPNERIKEILTPDMILRCYCWEPVGSRITCDPPPTDTDEDWLLRVIDLESFCKLAVDSGWGLGTSLKNNPEFASLKLEDVNLICTQQLEFWDKFRAASSVAKRLNLLNKDDRIALFRAVLYAEHC